VTAVEANQTSILKKYNVNFAFLKQFDYVGTQVTMASFLINCATKMQKKFHRASTCIYMSIDSINKLISVMISFEYIAVSANFKHKFFDKMIGMPSRKITNHYK
jgi:fucose permease